VSERTDGRSDEQLMRDWAGGDGQAFERLFERHRRVVHTFLLQHSGSRAAAEDLFQEVFLRVVRGRDAFQAERGSFRTWLFTIARNTLTDRWRRRGREPAVDGAERALEQIAVAGPDSNPLALLRGEELRTRIVAALEGLPAEQREVFLLRELVGLGFQDVAEVTGCRVPTAKSRMRYALEGLRRALAPAVAGEKKRK
jgi:RNA polymerase sigma-70 factor (ECF subfamily)